MENKYLKIRKVGSGFEVSSYDGVFSSIATLKDRESLAGYCKKEADKWLNSDLSNFDHIRSDERKITADKWLKSSDLPEGRYDYYFNNEKPEVIFKSIVKEYAKLFGLKYKLEIR